MTEDYLGKKFTGKVIEGRLVDDVARAIGRAIKENDGKFVRIWVEQYEPPTAQEELL